MKKTLNLGFGRQPQDNFNFVLNIFLFMLISSYIPKISLLACLILKLAMKKTLKWVFWRRPYNISNVFLWMDLYWIWTGLDMIWLEFDNCWTIVTIFCVHKYEAVFPCLKLDLCSVNVLSISKGLYTRSIVAWMPV